MCAMLCTRPDVCLAISLAGGTKVIQEWITGQGQEHPEIPEKD